MVGNGHLDCPRAQGAATKFTDSRGAMQIVCKDVRVNTV